MCVCGGGCARRVCCVCTCTPFVCVCVCARRLCVCGGGGCARRVCVCVLCVRYHDISSTNHNKMLRLSDRLGGLAVDGVVGGRDVVIPSFLRDIHHSISMNHYHLLQPAFTLYLVANWA